MNQTIEMPWKKKRRLQGKNRYYSVVKKLRREGKIDKEFEAQMNSLLLEEVIAIKLELAAKASGAPVYGVPIWSSLVDIVRDATLKFAFSATRTKIEAARFLGIDYDNFAKLCKKFKTESYFEEEKDGRKDDNLS